MGEATGGTVGVGTIDASADAYAAGASDATRLADGAESVEAGNAEAVSLGSAETVAPGAAETVGLGGVDPTEAVEQPAAVTAIANPARRAAARGRRADTAPPKGTTARTMVAPMTHERSACDPFAVRAVRGVWHPPVI